MPYVNIKITKEGNVTPEQKRQLIEGATKLLADVLHKNTKTLVVTIDEVDMDNWGIGGVPVTELRKIAKEKAAADAAALIRQFVSARSACFSALPEDFHSVAELHPTERISSASSGSDFLRRQQNRRTLPVLS